MIENIMEYLATCRNMKVAGLGFRVSCKLLILKAGGGGRTRTYEGLASGFTVRPLCHSGHSPMPAGPGLADENALGWPRRVAARLMLPHGSACQLEI